MTAPSRPKTRMWLRSPLAILADNAAGGLVIEGDVIVECLASGQHPSAPVDITFDASSHVVTPGLINTHHHFYQTLTRAHPVAINKALFPWLVSLYPVWARLDEDAMRVASELALTELLLSGCTTAADHHYVFPKGLENAVDMQVDAAQKVGMRMTISRGSMNLSKKDGGLPPDSVVQDEDVILADSERVLNRYHDRSPGAQIQIALAPCSPFSVDKTLMQRSAELAERFDCTLHTHLAETLDENDYCESHYGCRPVDLLEETGWLQARTWLAHGIHFTDEEIGKLGRHQVGISHCPTSNAVLASGFCPVRSLQAAGAPVGLGVDGSASSDSSNLMEAVRHALMMARLRDSDAEATTHKDALRLATEGSAACLRRDDIGTIAPGKQADLALYALNDLRFSGAQDALAALVLCGAHHADRVMIAGQWKVVDGLPIHIDLNELRARHAIAAARFA